MTQALRILIIYDLIVLKFWENWVYSYYWFSNIFFLVYEQTRF